MAVLTKIEYQGYKYIWSTADFKDGGVSASICTPYMWSLYEYIWEYTIKKFIVDSKILRPSELPRKLGEMFYGNVENPNLLFYGTQRYSERTRNSYIQPLA